MSRNARYGYCRRVGGFDWSQGRSRIVHPQIDTHKRNREARLNIAQWTSIGGGGHWAVPELLSVAGVDNLEGILVGLANWPGKRQADLEKRFIARTGEKWFGHDSIFAYVNVMILKEALERTGVADRRKVTEAIRSLDITDGPALFFPDGRLRYDEKGRRVGAKLCVVQWRSGKPVPVYPPSIATNDVLWPKV
jgi:branched-chain amino acid transport system substrate-binding protein